MKTIRDVYEFLLRTATDEGSVMLTPLVLRTLAELIKPHIPPEQFLDCKQCGGAMEVKVYLKYCLPEFRLCMHCGGTGKEPSTGLPSPPQTR